MHRILLGFTLTLSLGPGFLFSQETGEPARTVDVANLEQQKETRLHALRDALRARDKGRAEALAAEIVKYRPRRARDRERSEALDREREKFVALLTLQPSQPREAAELGRALASDLEATVPSLPAQDLGRAWIMIAQIREQLLGDPAAAIAAYEIAAKSENVQAAASAKISRLSLHHPRAKEGQP